MRMAVVWDFGAVVCLEREGIGLYCSRLLEVLLDYDADLSLEFWQYSFNIKNIRNVYGFLEQKYPGRVSFYDEMMASAGGWAIFSGFLQVVGRAVYFCLKPVLSFFKIFLSPDLRLSLRKIKTKANVFIGDPSVPSESLLAKAIQELSKAEGVYVPHPSLTGWRFFQGKKIVQIHDLITLPLRDSFLEIIPRIDEFNAAMVSNLEDLAKAGAVFVSSSAYVAQHHTRRYVQGVKPEQLAVVPFPAIMKEFNSSKRIDRTEFKKRYALGDAYLAYPTQIRPNKNSIVLLKALKRLRERSRSVQLATTGTFSSVPSWKKYIQDNELDGSVLEIGPLTEEELYALYKYSNGVVVPTMMEGLGISGQCLEALKVGGIPVVHAKSMGIAESLQSVGLSFETADLNWFELSDDAGLAEKIASVLNDPESHIKKQKHIIDYYSRITWRDVAKRYVEIM